MNLHANTDYKFQCSGTNEPLTCIFASNLPCLVCPSWFPDEYHNTIWHRIKLNWERSNLQGQDQQEREEESTIPSQYFPSSAERHARAQMTCYFAFL